MKLNSVCNEITSQLGTVSENPYFEAKELIKHVCCLNETEFLLSRDKEISIEREEKLYQLAKQRVSGFPLQYILGEWDFMGHTFLVGEGVLIPRPETEILCQYVIDFLKNTSEPCVIDLCSGSGCIALSVKIAVENAEVYSVEKSEDAYRYLEQNNANLCKDSPVTLIRGDIFKIDDFGNLPLADVIVSNPPYINSDEIELLQKEVRYEPVMALDGGEDGLDFYRCIITKWERILKPDGIFAFECGEEQADKIKIILKENGFDSFICKDYNNIERFVIGRRY